MSVNLGRVMTAMITPFKADGSINFDAAIQIVDYLTSNGTETVLLNGTTGESPALTLEEGIEYYKVLTSHFKTVQFMIGTGSNNTRTAVWHTQQVEKLPVVASLQVVPYYNRPSQEGLYQHFKTIAQSTKLPIILYNVPGRTGANLDPETVARLAQDYPNIMGLKAACGKVEQVKKVRELTGPNFLIYSGDDAKTLEYMKAANAYGVISVASHCVGNQLQEMIQCFLKGDVERAESVNQHLQLMFDTMFITSNPMPVKYAMNVLGFDAGKPRLPLVEPTDAEKKKIESVIEQYHLTSIREKIKI